MNDKLNRDSRKRFGTFLTALFVIAMALGTRAAAQEVRTIAKGSVIGTPESLRAALASPFPQTLTASMTSLPEAEEIVFLSPRLILTEAAARVLPEKELAELREGLSQTKKEMGIDLANIDYVVLQVRFKKPNANLEFSLPEFMLVASGDFSAEALVQFAKSAAKDKVHDESYGSKTLGVMTIDEVVKQAEKTPFLKGLSQVAIVALNGNTVAVGSPGYLKAAIDAAGGKGRINADLLNSVMRDPTALISMAGSPWTAFAKTFALLGTENNPRAPKCDSKLGDFYAAITMDATAFKFRGAMYADNPDTAKIIKSLLSSLLQQAAGLSKDKNAQALLNSLVITPTDTEVLVQAEVPQQAVADLIKQQSAPKKPVGVIVDSPQSKETSKPIHRRRHRRPTKTGPPAAKSPQ